MIKNSKTLGGTGLRDLALEMIEAAYYSLDTKIAIQQKVRNTGTEIIIGGKSWNRNDIGKLIVVGAGKCAFVAAEALEEILGDWITDGVIIDQVCQRPLKHIKTCVGDHPFPTERNIDGTRLILELLVGLSERDLVLVIVSGGGSTMLCQPGNFTCQSEGDLVQVLFHAGATIQELNTVRKHLSSARGGFLSATAYPAEVVGLIFSDVPGDNLEFIASGPTTLDSSTIADALAVMKKYDVNQTIKLRAGDLIETPKDKKSFDKTLNILVVSNHLALEAMAEVAMTNGFQPEIVSTEQAGEAKEVGEMIKNKIENANPGQVFLWGGETTVTVDSKLESGMSQGGRNAEVALAALAQNLPADILICSFASDGRDNGPHAGAWCDTITEKSAAELNLRPEEFLARHDSYGFFTRVGDFLETGPTGANVSDLMFAIKNLK